MATESLADDGVAALEERNRLLEREVQDFEKLTRRYRAISPVWWYEQIRSAFKN